MNLAVRNKAGRPKRHRARRLGTRAWFRNLMLAGGFSSATEVERHLEPDLGKSSEDRDGDGIYRPRKYAAYQKGARVPQRLRGSRYAVDVAEAAFPGTAKLFESPLWDVLEGRRFTAGQTVALLQEMDAEVREVLLRTDAHGHLSLADFDSRRTQDLIALGSFDAVVAAVLLLALSQVESSPGLELQAAIAMIDLLKLELHRIEPLAPFAAELMDLVVIAFPISDRVTIKGVEDHVITRALMGPPLVLTMGPAIPWKPRPGTRIKLNGEPITLELLTKLEHEFWSSRQREDEFAPESHGILGSTTVGPKSHQS